LVLGAWCLVLGSWFLVLGLLFVGCWLAKSQIFTLHSSTARQTSSFVAAVRDGLKDYPSRSVGPRDGVDLLRS
jgi:hypothetical protein